MLCSFCQSSARRTRRRMTRFSSWMWRRKHSARTSRFEAPAYPPSPGMLKLNYVHFYTRLNSFVPGNKRLVQLQRCGFNFSPCIANEGPVRIQYKCLDPVDVFQEIKPCGGGLVISRTEFCFPLPSFHIHVLVSDLYFPRIGLPILLQPNRQIHECRQELGLRPRKKISFFRNT